MQIQNHTLRPSSKLPQATIFQEQLQRILDRSAEGPNLRHLHDVVAIISNTGIRVNELCALQKPIRA
jgi:integrase